MTDPPTQLKPDKRSQEEADHNQNPQQGEQRKLLSTRNDELRDIRRELDHVSRLKGKPNLGPTVEQHVNHASEESLPGERNVCCAMVNLVVEIALG